MIDLNPSSMIRSEPVAAIHAAIAANMKRHDKRRTYVGASSIGEPCDRQIQYEFLGTPHDEGWKHDPRTLRIFQRGHLFESMAALWLCDAGFRLTQTPSKNAPVAFSAVNGTFAGHADRIITGGPLVLSYPFIWEHKALGAKAWGQISRRGVTKAKPEYADQVAVYQAYLDLTAPALFMATNADTMEIHLEFVPFDKMRAQKASDRAVAIIQDTKAGALRARCTGDPEFYACVGCQFRKRCWA